MYDCRLICSSIPWLPRLKAKNCLSTYSLGRPFSYYFKLWQHIVLFFRQSQKHYVKKYRNFQKTKLEMCNWIYHVKTKVKDLGSWKWHFLNYEYIFEIFILISFVRDNIVWYSTICVSQKKSEVITLNHY